MPDSRAESSQTEDFHASDASDESFWEGPEELGLFLNQISEDPDRWSNRSTYIEDSKSERLRQSLDAMRCTTYDHYVDCFPLHE